MVRQRIKNSRRSHAAAEQGDRVAAVVVTAVLGPQPLKLHLVRLRGTAAAIIGTVVRPSKELDGSKEGDAAIIGTVVRPSKELDDSKEGEAGHDDDEDDDDDDDDDNMNKH